MFEKQQYPEQVINYGKQKTMTKGPIITESNQGDPKQPKNRRTFL